MSKIPTQIIKNEMISEIVPDGASWGMIYELNTGDPNFTVSEVKSIRKAASAVAFALNLEFQSYTFMEEVEDENSDDNGKQPSVCLKLMFYENNLNTNRLLRAHLESECGADLSNYKSTNVSAPTDNFVPVVLRMSSDRENVLDAMANDVPALIYKSLENIRGRLISGLNEVFGNEYQLRFKHYNIGGIELSLDVPTAAGVDYASHPEIGLRLARRVVEPRSLTFTKVDDQSYGIPTETHKYLECHLRRVFNSQLIAGIPTLYGHLKDHSELMVVTKEIPHSPVSAGNTNALNFWLTRFEWRLKRNARLTSGSKLIESYGGSSVFDKLDELKKILRNLSATYMDLLRECLNVSMALTDEIAVLEAGGVINQYHPSNSFAVAAFLTSAPGRINVNAPMANRGQLRRGLEAGVFEKPEGETGSDFMLVRDKSESSENEVADANA